jgi:SAM-dependent methyltransferase
VPADRRAVLRRLYRGLDGFGIPAVETDRIRAAGSSATYGELMPTATLRLLARLDLGEDDALYDLGCGTGKLVLLAALTRPLARATGIELSPTRTALARRALARARRSTRLCARVCSFRTESFLRSDLSDATVVYTCSTAFPTPLMRRLAGKLARIRSLRLFATLQDLDPHPAFELVEILRLDVSWRRRAAVHLYRAHPGRR